MGHGEAGRDRQKGGGCKRHQFSRNASSSPPSIRQSRLEVSAILSTAQASNAVVGSSSLLRKMPLSDCRSDERGALDCRQGVTRSRFLLLGIDLITKAVQLGLYLGGCFFNMLKPPVNSSGHVATESIASKFSAFWL